VAADPAVPGTVGVVSADDAVKLFTNVVVQVTVLPPPLEDPLH
jgi:hypothetical protein